MAEWDLLVMGIAAKSYLDENRKKAPKEIQMEIDRLWIKIVIQEEKRQRIREILK